MHILTTANDSANLSLETRIVCVCHIVVLYIAIFLCSIQKDPAERMSASELLNHPFINKFEDKDLDLRILVGSLEPPMNIPE